MAGPESRLTGPGCSQPVVPALVALAVAQVAWPGIAGAGTVDELIAQGRYCSATAQALFQACGNQTDDEYLVSLAICINESDSQDRAECLADARSARIEDRNALP